MAKSKQLTEEQRLMVIVKVKEGISYAKIASSMNISKPTVVAIVKKYRKTGSVKHQKGAGRPKKTSAREDRIIVRTSLSRRSLTSPDIRAAVRNNDNINCSVSTIRRRLVCAGLRARRAAKKPLLTAEHRRKRRAFAAKYRTWTINQWKKVLWSDESTFQVFCGGSAGVVRRREGERFHPACIIPTVKHGGGSLMVWGCMSGHGVGQLYRCTGTMNQHQYIEVLENHMLPSARNIAGLRNRFVFQHDNAPCHKAMRVGEYLATHNVRVLDWPPQSPDLNPIEHLWEILFRKVQGLKPGNANELWDVLVSSWNDISPDVVQTLVESMPRRLAAVLKANGGHTKY